MFYLEKQMPLYDYECLGCGHRFEIRQRFSEAGTAPCPVCQSNSRRVFHSVPILFKGSGFYSTDNKRSAASRSADGKEEKKEGKAEAKSEDKGKEKPKEKVASKAEGKGSGESSSSKSD